MAPPIVFAPIACHPVCRQKHGGIGHRRTAHRKWQRPEHGFGKQPDSRVDAQMHAGPDAVAHAEQDHPGKQDPGKFKRSAPTGVEAVAGNHLGEGHDVMVARSTARKFSSKRVINPGRGVPQAGKTQPRLPVIRQIESLRAPPCRRPSLLVAVRPVKVPGYRLIAGMASCAISRSKHGGVDQVLADVAFELGPHRLHRVDPWSCAASGVSSRMVPPALRMFWRFAASFLATEAIGFVGHIVDDGDKLVTHIGIRPLSHSVEVTRR
jgi:hypothetical protein